MVFLGKLAVFGQELLYLAKNGCVLVMWLYLGKSGYNFAKLLYSGKAVIFGQVGCIRAKWL